MWNVMPASSLQSASAVNRRVKSLVLAAPARSSSRGCSRCCWRSPGEGPHCTAPFAHDGVDRACLCSLAPWPQSGGPAARPAPPPRRQAPATARPSPPGASAARSTRAPWAQVPGAARPPRPAASSESLPCMKFHPRPTVIGPVRPKSAPSSTNAPDATDAALRDDAPGTADSDGSAHRLVGDGRGGTHDRDLRRRLPQPHRHQYVREVHELRAGKQPFQVAKALRGHAVGIHVEAHAGRAAHQLGHHCDGVFGVCEGAAVLEPRSVQERLLVEPCAPPSRDFRRAG